jgi:hypothetical protein
MRRAFLAVTFLALAAGAMACGSSSAVTPAGKTPSAPTPTIRLVARPGDWAATVSAADGSKLLVKFTVDATATNLIAETVSVVAKNGTSKTTASGAVIPLTDASFEFTLQTVTLKGTFTTPDQMDGTYVWGKNNGKWTAAPVGAASASGSASTASSAAKSAAASPAK